MMNLKSCFVFFAAISLFGAASVHAYIQVPQNKVEFAAGLLKGKDTNDSGIAVELGYGLTDHIQLDVGYSHYNDRYKQAYSFRYGGDTYIFDSKEDRKLSNLSVGLTGKIDLPLSALRLSGSRFFSTVSTEYADRSVEGFLFGAQLLFRRNSKVNPYIAFSQGFYSDEDIKDNGTVTYGVNVGAAKNLNLGLSHSVSEGVGITTLGMSFYH